MDTAQTKTLPQDISSHDLIKSFAVIIMIIDHMGYYFFPEDLWWRSVGRIGFPVWFFLAGYSSGRSLPVKLWAGALILVLANCVVGLHIFPLNALVTIMAIRLLIDPLMKFMLEDRRRFWPVSVILFCLVPPTYAFSEYGSQAVITAIFGYLVRHKDKITDEKLVINYMIFALLTFVVVQQLTFGFSPSQFLFMGVGTMLVRTHLLHFSNRTYPRMTQVVPGFVKASFQFMGRHTLEIYVVHLLIFKFVALALGDERFGWFDPSLVG